MVVDLKNQQILVTGGCGYIGAHTCVELASAGYEPVVFDNLCNGSRVALTRVENITGRPIPFFQGDVRNPDDLRRVFSENRIAGVLHFAGLKSPAESIRQPLRYFDNNVAGTSALLGVMDAFGIKKIVFSSTAAVYGVPDNFPVTESSNADRASHPYGQSKRTVEQILQNLQYADPEWKAVALRYFNPVGAHRSGLIGENPLGTPNNLVPYIAEVAIGRRKYLSVYGNDYETCDGTGVRDYVHVSDLAKGHVAALDYVFSGQQFLAVNLGTGRGYSVLEVVRAFEQVCGMSIPLKIAGRRQGDVACCYADTRLANEKLNWHAEAGLEQMCADAWKWQSMNPQGFA